DPADSVVVAPNGVGVTSQVLGVGEYLLKASGTYTYRNHPTAKFADAAFSLRAPEDGLIGQGPDNLWYRSYDLPSGLGHLGIKVNGALTDWGSTFSSAHEYEHALSSVDGIFSFEITDNQYNDNSG